jgi:mannose-6-phosphate isomerase-like protein (cupin superfamily)
MRKPAFVLTTLALLASPLFAQAPSPQPQAPPSQPQAPRPVARPPAPAPTPTVTVQVSDSSGLPLSGVQVTTTSGPVSRDGSTADDGVLRFVNMRPGGYRLRFVREGSITLERDLIVRTGEPQLVDVSLSAAPVAPKPVEPPRAAAPAAPGKPLGAPADPKLTAIPTYLEKNFIGREGRKDSALGCTSTASSILVQLREAMLNQTHEDADEWIYVVAGEGTLRIGSSDQHVQAGTFSLVPHSVSYGILPGGKNPLIFVSVLSGRSCV